MVRIIIILGILFIGWQVTSIFRNNNGTESAALLTTDSLQAKVPLYDSTLVDSVKAGANKMDTVLKRELSLPGSIDTKGVHPDSLVRYAKTLMGVRYQYGSANPQTGFDCSGFITYVFKNFGVVVPRSSIDFTNVGREVSAAEAKPGDLILFTGTDSLEKFVGHMGIVVSNTDSLRFIHSTSGRKYGVTITPLNRYYQSRYVKTIRVFP